MATMPTPRSPSPVHDHHDRDHDQSESDSKPLLDHGNAPAGSSHEFHNPVYEPDYSRYGYTDNYYPSGPNASESKLDEPFTPKPEQYSKPQEYARQTRYEDMGASSGSLFGGFDARVAQRRW